MAPQKHYNDYTETQPEYPTSPWTEPYQAKPADANEKSMASQRAYETEAQRPTHDALSDIYNRGY